MGVGSVSARQLCFEFLCLIMYRRKKKGPAARSLLLPSPNCAKKMPTLVAPLRFIGRSGLGRGRFTNRPLVLLPPGANTRSNLFTNPIGRGGIASPVLR